MALSIGVRPIQSVIMRSLFFKIFAWFWLAVMLVAGAAVVAAIWFYQPPEHDLLRWRTLAGGILATQGQAAIDAFENDGEAGLALFLDRQPHPRGVDTFLYDQDGLELLRQPAPPLVVELVKQVRQSDETQIHRTTDETFVATAVAGAGNSEYVVVRRMPTNPPRPPPGRPDRPGPRDRLPLGPGGRPRPLGPAQDRPELRGLNEPRVPPRGFRDPMLGNPGPDPAAGALAPGGPLEELFAQPRVLAIVVAVIVITGGLVCFGLARYLTRPVGRLRAATRELASGRLTVRVAASIGARRDEIADLGRDFDFMAERIEALVSIQQRLLRDISHELRSPLARLNVALEIARKHAGEELGVALTRIERESERLNDLIGELLTLARLESGVDQMQRERVDLVALLERLVADADFEAASRNRRVRLIAENPCSVDGSGEMLRRAFENVIRNAVTYTAENSDVDVALETQPSADAAGAVITVCDHGPGVPEATLNDLFRPFYRVDDARNRGAGGTGLGLAIADRAIRAHGGSVQASNLPAGGLKVEIRIPSCFPSRP